METRGQAQCNAYVAQPEAAATELALGQGAFRSRDDLLPGLRVRRAGQHLLFCLPRDDQPALILAILHERMDIITRLQERLDCPDGPARTRPSMRACLDLGLALCSSATDCHPSISLGAKVWFHPPAPSPGPVTRTQACSVAASQALQAATTSR